MWIESLFNFCKNHVKMTTSIGFAIVAYTHNDNWKTNRGLSCLAPRLAEQLVKVLDPRRGRGSQPHLQRSR